MCLILIAHRASARYPLVIAANRDEAYARPALPAGAWSDCPDIVGGRDLEAGGTWMALSRTGRFAALTNFRQGGTRDASLRSRGALVAGYLASDVAPQAYLQATTRDDGCYNGYSLLAGDHTGLWFHSNRGNGVAAVAPGVHGLSNHLLDEPWPKVTEGVAVLEQALTLDVAPLMARLFLQLSDRTPAPAHALPATGIAPERERELSASFIAAPRYGTRASTVIVVAADGRVDFAERTFGPQGMFQGEQRLSFTLEASPVPPAASRDVECPLP